MQLFLLPTIFCLIGFLIIFLSYQIKYKKQAYLISGYDPETVTDKDAYCIWFGSVLLWPGIYSIFTGLLFFYFPGATFILAIAFVFVVFSSVALAISGGRQFIKTK